MNKMLVNLVNMTPDGIPIIWLIKLKRWQELGYETSVEAGLFIKKIDLNDKDVYEFNKSFSELSQIPRENPSKIEYIFHAIKRNSKVFFDYSKIKKQKFDVIYTPSSVLEFILFPFFYRQINPQVKWITVFDNTVPFSGPGSFIIRTLAWIFFQISVLLLKRADHVYAITPDLRSYLLKRGFAPEKISVTGCAVEKEMVEKATKIENIRIDALFMGRIHEKKGIYDMLESLKLVKKELPDFQLAIMGEGDKITTEKFKNKIKELGLENNIQLLGYQKGREKFDIIKSSKLFWFFSHDESFGVALLEAVCTGLPALVYDLAPFRYIYQNDEVKVFEKGNYEEIAKATIKIIQEKTFNQAGVSLLERFNWNKIVDIEAQALNKIQ